MAIARATWEKTYMTSVEEDILMRSTATKSSLLNIQKTTANRD
jgi:hypothetical protein